MICLFCKKDLLGDNYVSFCRNHDEFFIMFFENSHSFSICKGQYEIEVFHNKDLTVLRSHDYKLEGSPSNSVSQYYYNGFYYGDFGDSLVRLDISFLDLCPDNFDKYFVKLIKLVIFS